MNLASSKPRRLSVAAARLFCLEYEQPVARVGVRSDATNGVGQLRFGERGKPLAAGRKLDSHFMIVL